MKTCYLMVGMPNVGKSTFVKKELSGLEVVSRDEELMKYGKEKFGDISYSEIWKNLTPVDHKIIDDMVDNRIRRLQEEGKDFVVDMTLLSKKSRKKMYDKIDKDYKIRIVNLITGFDTILKRNKERAEREGKYIPEDVLRKMWLSYEPPIKAEDERIEKICFLNT